MDIQLESVRVLLRRTLGYDSFTAGFVSSIRADEAVPTAGVNAAGALRYNPGFVREHVRSEADLFCLVFHELLHPAFGHFIYGNDEITNIACDAIINSVITNLFPEPSARGCLFVDMYRERGLTAILRGGSKLSYSRYRRLYEFLYPPRGSQTDLLSAGEVIQTLKALTPASEDRDILLVGSHSADAAGSEVKVPRWSDKLTAQVSRDIVTALKQAGTRGGFAANLTDLVIEVLTTKHTVREDLLLGYATRRKFDAFFDDRRRQRRITSPFPVNPSRRDMVLLSAGVWPGFFRNRQPEVVRQRKGVAIYLDVSGSVNKSLPEIVGLLSPLRKRISTVYLFSNKAVEVPFETLCAGKVQTTIGTDFDCVAESVVEHEYERAVVFTDGYAELAERNTVALSRAGTRLLVVLFGGSDGCEPLAAFGEVVQLEAMVQ